MPMTRQQFKQILVISVFVAISSFLYPACAEQNEAANHDSHSSQNSLDWPGIYYGFLPCDDCKGVKATLALNKNNTYILITQYVGKSEREIVEKGKFSPGDKSNTLVLSPRKSTATKLYYVGENQLIQLDDDGNRITGKLADRYILRRTDVTDQTMAHPSH